MKELKTLCPYCGVGCGLLASTDGSKVTRIRADPTHPANFGKMCQKGATVAQTIDSPTRLHHAMLRANREDPLLAVSPSQAIREVALKLDAILQQHGPHAIAFYLSGQLTTESQYFFNKFGKGVLRTNHVDSNSRLCMSSAASAMSTSLGSDGPPTCYADIELADTFMFVGSNAAECHPVTFDRVRKRIEKARAECIVVDPRRTPTAEAATLHLAIKPGTDLALMNGLLHLLRNDKKVDEAYISGHTEGWVELNAMLDEYPPDVVSKICGIPMYDIVHAARIIGGQRRRLITFWTMGVNQSVNGTFTGNAIINLHLAMGQIGRPGCGPFSLTGQPNAMGGRDVGYMSHLLPGQRKISDSEDRLKMEQLWKLEPGTIYPHAGYDAVGIFDALARGEIKALWVVGSNPAASMPNLPVVRKGLENAELVVLQDAYSPTETSRFAHVLFPAAIHMEQEGTFCNSERRVSLMEQVVPAPGDARPDWWWGKQVAAAMGFTTGLGFNHAAEIFDEFAGTTLGCPNDQSAMSHNLLRKLGPQQWPFSNLHAPATRRYEAGYFPTPTTNARLLSRRYLARSESPSREYPLLLTTGRVAGQWHTRTKTGLVPALNKLDPAPYLQMHPEDAESLRLTDGRRVQIRSSRGVACSTLKVDDAMIPGTVFMPMHWNDLWSEGASPNEVTTSDSDPVSLQPALKCCAVSVNALHSVEDASVAVAKSVGMTQGERA